MFGLMIYAAAAAILLLAPILGLWPPIREGRAWNGLLRIQMPEIGALKYETHSYRALFAQELVEFHAAWLGAVLIMTPIACLLSLALPDPAGGLVAVVLLPLAWMWRNSVRGERWLEYLGHTAEVIVAERLGTWPGFTAGEPERMRTGYARLFRDTTAAEIARGIDRWRPVARAYLALLAWPISRARP